VSYKFLIKLTRGERGGGKLWIRICIQMAGIRIWSRVLLGMSWTRRLRLIKPCPIHKQLFTPVILPRWKLRNAVLREQPWELPDFEHSSRNPCRKMFIGQWAGRKFSPALISCKSFTEIVPCERKESRMNSFSNLNQTKHFCLSNCFVLLNPE